MVYRIIEYITISTFLCLWIKFKTLTYKLPVLYLVEFFKLLWSFICLLVICSLSNSIDITWIFVASSFNESCLIWHVITFKFFFNHIHWSFRLFHMEILLIDVIYFSYRIRLYNHKDTMHLIMMPASKFVSLWLKVSHLKTHAVLNQILSTLRLTWCIV